MKPRRLFLVLGVIGLIAVSITGCLQLSSASPQALFTASPAEDVVPFTASFDGTLSYASSGEIVSYLWTFGDGGAEKGPVANHKYTENGAYEVSLTVIDDRGMSASTVMTVTALNPLPTAGFTYSPKSTLEGDYIVGASEWITFDATESCDDGDVVSYNWTFGDGEYGEGKIVEHRYLYPGTYNVVLTVTDNDEGQASYVEKITVLGGPPCNADITDGGEGTCQ